MYRALRNAMIMARRWTLASTVSGNPGVRRRRSCGLPPPSQQPTPRGPEVVDSAVLASGCSEAAAHERGE